MNVINKLTLRHMRLNKKRTLVTIVGVIISVAMITAVATLGVSFMDMFARESIRSSGLWHVEYSGLNSKQLNAVEHDEDTLETSVRREEGYVKISDPKSKYRPYLFVEEYNDVGMKNFFLEPAEGRLPQKSGEIVIPKDLLEKEEIGWKIGDTVTLELGERRYLVEENEDWISESTGFAKEEATEKVLGSNYSMVLNNEGVPAEHLVGLKQKEYKIVGIVEIPETMRRWNPAYVCISYFDTASFAVEGGGSTADAYVVLRNPSSDLYEWAQILATQNEIPSYQVNNRLLRYMGIIGNNQERQMIMGLSVVIMVIIMIGSVSLIYNAFAISVSERSRHLGMLSSVGATARQKRNSVFFEGAAIGVISIPIGILAGLLGIGITFHVINPVLNELLAMGTDLQVVVRPWTIFTAVLISIFTIFISAYIPAKRASKVAPIDAIRQTGDIKLSSRAIKTAKITSKLFGVEGNVALKNLKRNKRRYKATVFSLIISLVLFLTVSYFGQSFTDSYARTMEGIEYDVNVSISDSNKEGKDLTDRVMNAQYAEEAWRIRQVNLAMADMGQITGTRLFSLDNRMLRSYAESAGISADILFDETQRAAIVIDPITYLDEKQGKYVTKKVIEKKRGEEWGLYAQEEEKEDDSETSYAEVCTLRIEGFTELLPRGVSAKYWPDNAHIIVSEKVYDWVMEKWGEKPYSEWDSLYIKTSEPEKLTEELENMEGSEWFYINNLHAYRQQEERMMFLIKVFVYGFITLITLICIANIFNTICTSIALRKREFAMLRSIGMTPGGFNKMIRYESIFYGLKALLYGLPLSVLAMYLLYTSYMHSFEFPFLLPWKSIAYAIIAVFAVVFVTMLYASAKIKKENIIDSLRQEVI